MAYLSLTESTTADSIQTEPSGTRGAYGQEVLRVKATLSEDATRRWKDAVQQALESQTELRLDLAPGWTVFCKLAQEQCRLLMARPDHDQWVLTLSMTPEAWSVFWTATALRDQLVAAGHSLHPSSNVDWTWIAAR
jgi:hypothetical protein